MYCGNCGNKLGENDRFCEKCGAVNSCYVNNNQQQMMNSQPSLNNNGSKKNNWIIFLVIGIIAFIFIVVLFVLLILALVFGTLDAESTKEYVELSGDEIPTVYKVVGDRDICYTSTNSNSGEMSISYEYCSGEISSEDIEEYIYYLINYDDFVFESSYPSYVLTKMSNDQNMYIIVEIDVGTDKITYYKEYLEGGII